VRRRILVRPEAERDLEERAEHIACEWDLEAGMRYFRALEVTLELIASQPRMGSPRRFRSPALEGVRMCPVKGFEKHLIFYRPLREGIEVVRILHGARDIEQALEP
jgi:toxin ParE1/3/4